MQLQQQLLVMEAQAAQAKALLKPTERQQDL